MSIICWRPVSSIWTTSGRSPVERPATNLLQVVHVGRLVDERHVDLGLRRVELVRQLLRSPARWRWVNPCHNVICTGSHIAERVRQRAGRQAAAAARRRQAGSRGGSPAKAAATSAALHGERGRDPAGDVGAWWRLVEVGLEDGSWRSALHRAGGEAPDQLLLEDEEQDREGQDGDDDAREGDVDLVWMLVPRS